MAIRFYDEAMITKISKWIKDPNLRLLKPDETSRLFQMHSDIKNDKPLTLPLIALSRDKDVEILSFKKQPKTFNGFVLKSTKTQSVSINVVPIRIGYQLDIYTKGMAEADEYVRNFVFKFINNPMIKIQIPYNNMNIEHNATIYMDSNISDNSDIPEKLFHDQFQRFTIKLTIDDAYLFSLPIDNNTTLELGNLDVIDRISKEVVESSSLMN